MFFRAWERLRLDKIRKFLKIQTVRRYKDTSGRDRVAPDSIAVQVKVSIFGWHSTCHANNLSSRSGFPNLGWRAWLKENRKISGRAWPSRAQAEFTTWCCIVWDSKLAANPVSQLPFPLPMTLRWAACWWTISVPTWMPTRFALMRACVWETLDPSPTTRVLKG